MRGKSTEQSAITYLDADADVAAFLDGIRSARELAVDTEGASFHRFVDRVYLLQLSTRDRHAIVDPLAVTAPATLGAILADPRVEVVFHDADYDLRLLRQDYGWRVARLFDTRVAAQLLGIRQFGLAALLESNFGVKLDKKHQRADWSMRPLSADMLAYAAQDTRHLLELRDILRGALDKKGRLHWAEEEFERIKEVEWATDDGANAFLRMKGARDLSRRELAVLRELHAWRDTTAAGLDRATFRVLNNEALFDIARLAQASPGALTGIKGVPRGWSDARIADVLAAVQRGLAVPEADLPRFPRGLRWEKDPKFDERASALRTVRDAAATKLDLDPGVLCSRERLEAVARRAPASLEELREVKELRSWQIEVMGEAMIAAVR
jgi:ribonuclease D